LNEVAATVVGEKGFLEQTRIESTFGTVRLRTAKTRGCVSRPGMLAMVFKLLKTG
jgi:hypothetical protein